VLEKVCLNESGKSIILYTNIYNVDESGFTFRNPRKLWQQRGRKMLGLLPVAKKGRPSRWFAVFRQHAHIFRPFKRALEEVGPTYIKRNEKAEERE